MEMDSLQSVVAAKVIQALEQIKWSKSQNYVLTIKYQPMDIFMQPVRIETMTTPTAVHIRQAVSHCGKSHDRYARITVTHRDFTEVTLCSFCKIMVNHRDSDISTVIPNIGLDLHFA
jgi:hypothetical protein